MNHVEIYHFFVWAINHLSRKYVLNALLIWTCSVGSWHRCLMQLWLSFLSPSNMIFFIFWGFIHPTHDFFLLFVHLHNSSKFQFGTAHDHSLKSTSAHLYTTTIYILIIMYNIQVTQGKIVHATLAPALQFTKNGQTSNTKIGVQNTKLVRVSFFRPFYHMKQPIFFLSINNHSVYMQQIIVRQQCNW